MHDNERWMFAVLDDVGDRCYGVIVSGIDDALLLVSVTWRMLMDR